MPSTIERKIYFYKVVPDEQSDGVPYNVDLAAGLREVRALPFTPEGRYLRAVEPKPVAPRLVTGQHPAGPAPPASAPHEFQHTRQVPRGCARLGRLDPVAEDELPVLLAELKCDVQLRYSLANLFTGRLGHSSLLRFSRNRKVIFTGAAFLFAAWVGPHRISTH